MDKIYLYKTAVKSVSYDETHWYINDGRNLKMMAMESLNLSQTQELSLSV